MSRPKVKKVDLDWRFECAAHEEHMWCSNWEDALESAYGHFCMYHKPLKPLWEIVVTDGIWQTEVVTLAERVRS